MKITEFFVRRPVLFWSLMAAILIAGLLSFIQMPKLEDPAVAVKQAMVMVPYPGASAHEVELKVAQMMEDELRALPNVKKVKSECRNGSAMLTVEFQMTVLNRDLEQHFDLLRRKVNDAASRLPEGCYDPVVIDDMMDVYGIFYGLTADGYDYPEMYRYAKYLRRELLDVKGVKRILIAGNRDEVINIILSKEQIARNGVIPTQIMSALQQAGKTVNAGAYPTGEERIALYVDSAVDDVEEIRDLEIRTMDGRQLRIGDVARVERGYAAPQRNGFFVDGRPALALCIAMESSAIVPDVGKAVDARLAEAMRQLPAGFQTEKIFFQPDKVSEAISSFMWNLLESVVIVILVLIFTMGFRSGLIIGFGLVLTVAVSFPILLVCGTTLQRISLGAFIVAMGMLVDNAVVIMDGILIDKKRGLSPKVYLYRIGRNTAMPLLGATVIAASTFLGIYLSPDSAGEYAGDLFLVLCVSLLASWVLALVQVPICAKTWLPAREKRQAAAQKPAVMNSPVHRFVRRTISFLIGYKRTTIAAAVAVLILSIFGMTRVKNLFFPDFDYKQFVVECFFPSATNADRVRDRLLEMSDSVRRNPAVERVAVSQGSAPAHYCLVRPMTSGGDCYGELIVDCADYRTVQEQIPTIRRQLREAFPEAYIRIRKYNFSISTSHTVEVEFAGPDPAVLRDLSAQAEAVMRRCPYVDAYSVQNNWKPKGKALVAEFNQQDALRAGIGRGDVANALWYRMTQGYKWSQNKGLIALGLFKDEAEIASSPSQYDLELMPGDIKYKDINGDGMINDDDIVPIGNTKNPELVYGFGLSAQWKGFDFSVLFQGTGKTDVILEGYSVFPFSEGEYGNVLSAVADPRNRWISREISGTPATERQDAIFPRLSYGARENNQKWSTWWLRDGRFLRLKNLELGYTLPQTFTRKFKVERARIYFLGYNLACWAPFDWWDPEQGSVNGNVYPIQKTFTFGLNVSF